MMMGWNGMPMTFGGPYDPQSVIVITKENIQALILAAGVEQEARKLGGPEKFFTADIQVKAVGRR